MAYGNIRKGMKKKGKAVKKAVKTKVAGKMREKADKMEKSEMLEQRLADKEL